MLAELEVAHLIDLVDVVVMRAEDDLHPFRIIPSTTRMLGTAPR